MFKILIFLLFVIFAPVLIILALVDILRSEFSGVKKNVWVLVVIFMPLIGAFLYWAIGKNQKIQS